MRVTGLYAPLEILRYATGEHKKNAGKNAPRDTVENKYIHAASQCFHGKIYYGAQQCFHGDTNNAFCGVKKPIVTIQ